MSQHKYNDAYNKGFEDGKKKAFDYWVYHCYDELSPKEQIELLLSEGADLPRKAVIQALEDVRAEIAEYGSIWVEYTIKGHTDRDFQKTVEDVLKQAKTQVLESIDRKIKECTHETR